MYADAARQARRLPKASGVHGMSEWRLVGPESVGGRIVDIEYNPRSPDSIYAAAATGGVFLSADGGTNWEPIFDDQATLSIGDIAIDPADPAVIYVGTGEANGGHNNLPGAGLFKSTDGGTTWAASGLEDAVSIARIVIDPTNPDRLFAAVVGSYFAPGSERGVYRSIDGGASWDQVFSPGDDIGAIDLVINPSDPDILYVAMWERVRTYESMRLAGPGSGIYRSSDGGDTWTRLGVETGLPDGANVGRIGLTLCDSEPNVLYAIFTNGSSYLGLFRTDDGGDSWIDADTGRQAETATSNFSWYFGQIRVNPNDPEDVYLLDVGLVNTKDGGASWQRRALSVHVDHHALAFHPDDDGALIGGNDGGVGISSDFGETWTRVTDLPITQFYGTDVDPSDRNRIFGGSQDNGTIRRNPSDGSWSLVLGGDGFAPLIDPTNPGVVYFQSQRGDLSKSSDGGNTSFSVVSNRSSASGIPASDPRNWSTPVAIDPSNPQVLYYGTNRVYRTQDGALSWEAVSPVLPIRSLSSPRLGTVTSIAVSPSDPNVVYAGTDDGRVWVTLNSTADWTDISAGLPERWVTQVVADPFEPLTAYATFSGLKWNDPLPHVFRTTNAGFSWIDISSDLPDVPVNALVIDPANTSRLFVGTDIGAFVSADIGASWQSLVDGMPMVAVYDLDIHVKSRTLFASTHGRSIFSAGLPSVPVSAESDDLSLQRSPSLIAWPNPFTERVHLRLEAPGLDSADPVSSVGPVVLEVFDVRGRRVLRISNDPQSAVGRRLMEWDGRTDAGSRVPPGIYVIRIGFENAGRSAVTTVVRLGNDG